MDINTTIGKLESGEYQQGEILKFENWAKGKDKKKVRQLIFAPELSDEYNPIHHYSRPLVQLRGKIAETEGERKWAVENDKIAGIEVCDELLAEFRESAEFLLEQEFSLNNYKATELVWDAIWKYRMFMSEERVCGN